MRIQSCLKRNPPIQRINTRRNLPWKRGMRPFHRTHHESVFGRVALDVIDVPAQIVIIANQMIPITTLQQIDAKELPATRHVHAAIVRHAAASPMHRAPGIDEPRTRAQENPSPAPQSTMRPPHHRQARARLASCQ